MTPRALRAGGAFTETDQRLTFFVALPAPRLGSHRVEAPAKPDSSHVIPVKRPRESESERLHRTGFCHAKELRLRGTLVRFSSLRRESFGFSAKQVHPFAFGPSRDASADSGVLLGLAASSSPRSFLLERPPQRKMRPTDFCHPTNFEQLHPCLSVLELAFEESGVSRRNTLASANHLAFEEGFSPYLAHGRLNL